MSSHAKKKLPDVFIPPGFQEGTAGMGMQWGQDMARFFFDPAMQIRYAQQFSEGWFELWEGYLEGLTHGPDAIERHDVFLSHSKRDEKQVNAIKTALTAAGYQVYVDWSDDPLLDRQQVDVETANRLKAQMRRSSVLLLALSAESAKSPWVQWELGFFDAANGQVFVLPLDREADQSIAHQEYVGLYESVTMDNYLTKIERSYQANNP